MSAFVVSQKHLNEICSWVALHHEGYDWQELQRLGQVMWRENVKSVNWLYRGDEPEQVFRFVPKLTHISPIQFVKLLKCVDYQSCEHPTWEQSEAHKFVWEMIDYALGQIPGYDKEILKTSISTIPGYSEAEWSID